MGFLDRLAGREAKASRTTRAITRVVGTGQPVWMGRDYESFAREGYSRNAVVYACINQITSAAKGIPWVLYQGTGAKSARSRAANGAWKSGTRKGSAVQLRQRKQLDLVDTHPLLDLWGKPNPEHRGTGAFIETALGYLLLSGDTYLEAVFPNVQGAPPIELWPLRPDRMTVRPDPKNRVAGYRYQVGGFEPVDFKAFEVLHTKLFNPLNDWYGMSPIAAIARAVDRHNAAETWNTSLLQNGGRPSGAVVVKEPIEDEAEWDEFKRDVRAKATGADNAGRVLFLEGDFDWKEMGLSPQEMDWLNGQQVAATLICAGFGVSPILLDLSDHVQYANYGLAKAALYEETVLPLLDHWRDDLNSWLVPMFGDQLFLDYDRDEIEALQEDRQQVWERVKGATFLTEDEKRSLVGLDELPNGMGEVLTVPATIMRLPLSGEPQPAPAPADSGKPASEADQQDPGNPDNAKQRKAIGLATPEAKAAWSAEQLALRDAWEAKWQAAAAELFTREGDAVRRAVAASAAGTASDAAASAVDDHRDAWRVLFLAHYRAEMEDFGDRLLSQLKHSGAIEQKDGLVDWWSEEANRFVVGTAAKKVTAVSDTTKATIAALVGEGVNNGESMQSIADRIGSTYADMKGSRATMIARTETIGASNAGNVYAAKQSGLVLDKEWLATKDARTRDSHAELDGSIVPMDDTFTNGLRFPGDPWGEAAEVVNCRCTLTFQVA